MKALGRASGTDRLSLVQVRWYKDGSEIRKGKKYEIIVKGVQRILIVHKSVFDDEAEYECDARTSKTSGMLTVIGEKCISCIKFNLDLKQQTESAMADVILVSATLLWFVMGHRGGSQVHQEPVQRGGNRDGQREDDL